MQKIQLHCSYVYKYIFCDEFLVIQYTFPNDLESANLTGENINAT